MDLAAGEHLVDALEDVNAAHLIRMNEKLNENKHRFYENINVILTQHHSKPRKCEKNDTIAPIRENIKLSGKHKQLKKYGNIHKFKHLNKENKKLIKQMPTIQICLISCIY